MECLVNKHMASQRDSMDSTALHRLGCDDTIALTTSWVLGVM